MSHTKKFRETKKNVLGYTVQKQEEEDEVSSRLTSSNKEIIP
jgi:hypothetical protein